ncbi:hypothetical protein [Micromonospora sp. NBC_01638]|nr:hypothetical protein OG811_22875 [Micromonospora sp. NBC_01638]
MDDPRRLLDAAEQLRTDMVDRLSTLVSCESAPGSLPVRCQYLSHLL